MFIVFEGIDGCGKSTQVWKLARYFADLSKYNHVLVTREPYKLREIRNILRKDEPAETKSEELTKLFVKDREEHLKEIIKPALEKNIIVVCDRYKYSTICYQAAQGQDIKKLIEIHKNMLVPDFIFILDIPIEIAIKRMKKDNIREKEHKFEKNPAFLEKVRQNYLKLPALFPEEKIIILDGSKTIEKIFEEIKICLKNFKNI